VQANKTPHVRITPTVVVSVRIHALCVRGKSRGLAPRALGYKKHS
jgi:hypothetical protein